MNALFLNSTELIDAHWADVARLVAPAVSQAARGEFTLDDLELLVRSGKAFAGLASDASGYVLALVFEFRFYPRKQVINVMALGGQRLHETAKIFWPQFTVWAAESGATEIEACTSPAMTRMLTPLGFSHTYDIVRMTW
jgi:hypothetical protein